MLLTVADTPEKVERLRKMFLKLHYFTYCAVKEEMLITAEQYRPDCIVLETQDFTSTLKEHLEKILALMPETKIFLISDCTDHSLPVFMQLPRNALSHDVLYYVMFYTPRPPNSTTYLKENLLVHGLLFNIYLTQIRIFGRIVEFTPNDVFIMRYLAEIFPRRATAKELGALCFGYRVEVSEGTVASAISRINKRASKVLYGRPLISYVRHLGYTIDF